MPDLIAQGPKPNQRWRRRLTVGHPLRVGRDAGPWSVLWDEHVSRQHAEVRLDEGQLHVERLPTAANPIFVRGVEQDRFCLRTGEHFVIGATTFTLVDEKVNVVQDNPAPLTEQTISYDLLQQIRFDAADRRIDVLASLPDMLAEAGSDAEQAQKLLAVLLAATNACSFVALAELTEAGDVVVRQWDRRELAAREVLPSERLIRQAIESKASVIHAWRQDGEPDLSFTQHEGEDWAFCVPLRDDSASTWVAYAAGTLDQQAGGRNSLQEDVKFVDLACHTLVQLRRVRRLERERTSLGQFISPVVMEALANQDPEVALAPREAQVSVMFCDLRGFSRRSEQQSDDLLELLQRVSGALGVMTRQILEHGGVIGDFHGDSAMGFWGWPIEQHDAPLRACRAALCIRRELDRAARDQDHALADFRMGIGIASGRAVAGKIGTVDQVKVTVFGPVVNIASRLEGMTKALRAPILIDAETAEGVRNCLPADSGRLRRVARVRPAGMRSSVDVNELLPPAAEFPAMPDDGIAAYEEALDSLQALDWDKAFMALHRVPAEDRVKDFLTVFIAQHNRTPPDDWDGVIPLSVK